MTSTTFPVLILWLASWKEAFHRATLGPRHTENLFTEEQCLARAARRYEQPMKFKSLRGLGKLARELEDTNIESAESMVTDICCCCGMLCSYIKRAKRGSSLWEMCRYDIFVVVTAE